MAEPDLRAVVSAHSDRNIIIDYAQGDFENYWDSECKSLLHRCECDIIRTLLPPSNGWFLDIGCGFGRLIPTYLDPKRRIVAVDYSIRHLETASRTYPHDNVFFVAADAHHLPFRDGVFSSGICVRLFHHIASPEAFLREFSRVFTREAFLVFNYMNKRNLMRVLRYGLCSCQRDHARISRVLYATHPRFFARLAGDSGFAAIRQTGTGLVHQITHCFHRVERLIDAAPFLIRPLAAAERIGGSALGALRLALMQYVLLQKVSDDSTASSQNPPPRNLIDILLCPGCRSIDLQENETGIECTQCGQVYSRHGRIYDFRFAATPLSGNSNEREVPIPVGG